MLGRRCSAGVGKRGATLPTVRASRTLFLLAVSASALTAAAAAPAAHARVAETAAPEWIAPTPPEGQRFVVDAGATLKVQLAASDADPAAVVELAEAGAPPTATFVATPGNPASATFTWTASFREIGHYVITFTAQVHGSTLPPATRTIDVQVRKPPPFKLSGIGEVSRYAYVAHPTYARAEPRANARIVAPIGRMTSDYEPNLLLLLDGAYDNAGNLWIRVRLAILPNNSTGWIRDDALGPFRALTTHLIVNRSKLTAALYRNGRVVFRARVGVGRSYWPTPRGEFYVREKLIGFDDPFYGPLAFGLSARSAVLTDWPGGGFIGIHGTNAPQILPGRVSHGCVRMRNADILRLARLMPLGTPVTIT
jgi:L,D-transpeptidase catalytic domain